MRFTVVFTMLHHHISPGMHKDEPFHKVVKILKAKGPAIKMSHVAQTNLEIMYRIIKRYDMHWDMMTSSNGNIFRVTGPLCGEFTGPGEFTAQRPVTRNFDVFFDLRWVNTRHAGDMRRHCGHYDVNVMSCHALKTESCHSANFVVTCGWHRILSLWQSAVPPVTTKLTL